MRFFLRSLLARSPEEPVWRGVTQPVVVPSRRCQVPEKSHFSVTEHAHTRAGRAFRHDQPVVPTRTRTGWWFYPPLDVGAVRAPRLLTYKQQQQQVVNYDPLRRRGDGGRRAEGATHEFTRRLREQHLSTFHPTRSI